MPGVLRIRDTEPFSSGRGRGLSFGIRDLLVQVSEERAARLAWGVCPLVETWLLADLEPLGTTVPEFEERVHSSAAGVVMAWPELVAFAAKITQTVWGTHVGCEDADSFAGLGHLFSDQKYRYLDRAEPAFFEAVEFALQAVDSSYWFVYARDEEVFARLRSAFREVEALREW